MNYDVIIIGAGASGLTAAIAAARQGSSVLVLEQKDKAGKKILATGNGKCNFTNMIQKPECYRSEDSAFAMKVLSYFDVNKTLNFFGELGIYPKNREGYLYPNSEQAASVVQVLLMECERLKVNFRYNEAVIDIRKPEFTVVTEVSLKETDRQKSGNNSAQYNTAQYSVAKNNASYNKDITNKEQLNKNISNNKALNKKIDNQAENSKLIKLEQVYHGRKVILATGGCASPQLGSDGSGYRLAKSFGHTLIKPLPALVQLKSPYNYGKTVSGVRTAVKVTAYAWQKQIAGEEGEILFTDYGISGIPIMQISRFVAKAIDKGDNVHLLLDFIPELSYEALSSTLQKRISQNLDKNTEEMMVGLLNHKLSFMILKESKLDVYRKVSQLTKKDIAILAKNIKEFKILISDTNSFENAQVSAGGVSTKEVNEATMESKLTKNLYLTGELMDVDGTCGGYNLQWAWSTGYLAGSAAGKERMQND